MPCAIGWRAFAGPQCWWPTCPQASACVRPRSRLLGTKKPFQISISAYLKGLFPWWAILGSNQRPLRCERNALPLRQSPNSRTQFAGGLRGVPWCVQNNSPNFPVFIIGLFARVGSRRQGHRGGRASPCEPGMGAGEKAAGERRRRARQDREKGGCDGCHRNAFCRNGPKWGQNRPQMTSL